MTHDNHLEYFSDLLLLQILKTALKSEIKLLGILSQKINTNVQVI